MLDERNPRGGGGEQSGAEDGAIGDRAPVIRDGDGSCLDQRRNVTHLRAGATNGGGRDRKEPHAVVLARDRPVKRLHVVGGWLRVGHQRNGAVPTMCCGTRAALGLF